MRLPALVGIVLTSLAAPGVLAGNFNFTGPDLSQKLNLSAPITVSWSLPPDSPDAVYEQMDLWWGSNGFKYEIAPNYSLAVGAGSFFWDPINETKALLMTNHSLTRGKDFFFEGRLHHPNSTSGSVLQSQKYAVEGYPLINAGRLLRPGTGGVALAALLAAGMCVL